MENERSNKSLLPKIQRKEKLVNYNMKTEISNEKKKKKRGTALEFEY